MVCRHNCVLAKLQKKQNKTKQNKTKNKLGSRFIIFTLSLYHLWTKFVFKDFKTGSYTSFCHNDSELYQNSCS